MLPEARIYILALLEVVRPQVVGDPVVHEGLQAADLGGGAVGVFDLLDTPADAGLGGTGLLLLLGGLGGLGGRFRVAETCAKSGRADGRAREETWDVRRVRGWVGWCISVNDDRVKKLI